MKKWLLLYIALPMLLIACDPPPDSPSKTRKVAKVSNPSQDAFDLLYKNDQEDLPPTDICLEGGDENLNTFASRVTTEFAPRIACAFRSDGISESGETYGTLTMTFPNSLMTIKTDAIDGIVQTVEIKPEARLTRSWFERHRADFANGADDEMEWYNDVDPSELIYQYWAPKLVNTQVELTLRGDGTIAQIWFSDPN